jgi:phosphoribosylanthranilate isomerase
MTLVKICGITNLEDARASAEAGADMLGFNFYQPSKRYVTPQAAREIISQLPVGLVTMGVFVNEMTPERVAEIASAAGVSGLQLHGDESPEYCCSLKGHYVIKTLAVSSAFEPTEVLSYDVDAIMLDAKDDALRGGTGRLVDWTIARRVSELGVKLFLAGGLSPDNISAAILQVHPYAVDACSALEDAPGKKNHERIREFVKLAHNVKP